ncbi:MAG: HAD family hydrolase [Micromonosporaceae bacterium]|nr:HAD family hydrolase [Micromonosporaceae bacterium]
MAAVGLAIFDLDDTLLDRKALLRRWAEDWVTVHEVEPAEAGWLVAADGDGFVSRAEFFSSVRDRYGLGESVDRLIEQYWERIIDLVISVPSVTAAVGGLRSSGWRVAIATNGPARWQLAKIRRAGLEASVDAIAISEEVGAAKPDVRMFDAAASRCGTRLADGGWVIGDCPIRDVAGGRAAGLHTMWLSHGRVWDPDVTRPDAVVDNVLEAVDVLRSL